MCPYYHYECVRYLTVQDSAFLPDCPRRGYVFQAYVYVRTRLNVYCFGKLTYLTRERVTSLSAFG